MLRDLMTEDHRDCDDLFAKVEASVGRGDVAAAQADFEPFMAGMLAHFQSEENILFPAFEQATGITMGPTRMMRMEHAQMRSLMTLAVDALSKGDLDEYCGQAETLLIMMQQHNMKEENVLYPMCEQHLSENAAALSGHLREALAKA